MNMKNPIEDFAKLNSKLNWDDLKIVLAIGSTASLSGAARHLATSHATVYRRLSRIEEVIGARLFHRSRDGYQPTPAGELVVALAARVEVEVLSVERGIAGQDLKPSGKVRLTTTDSLFVGLLAPILADFQQDYPDITVEVAISNRAYDLSKREADVAIRPGNAPLESLVGRKLGRIRQAIYARAGAEVADTRQTAWIGVDGAMSYRDLETWIMSNGLADRIVQTADSVLAMQSSARAGVGVAVLPLYLGEVDPDLQRLSPPIGELATDLWILMHEDLRNTARIKALTEHVGKSLAERLEAFASQP